MKCALITGASGDIGRETARLFAGQGYAVVLHYYKGKEQAFALAKELSSLVPALPLQADIADYRQVEALVAEAHRQLNGVDVLVNNAGLGSFGLLAECGPDTWRRVMGVNLDGVYHTIRCCLPGMQKRGKGRILNVSSMWGITGASCEAAYSAAKAGVIGLTRALAKELGPSGITVNCVAPGVIETRMNDGLPEEARALLREQTPLGRFGTPREVAELLLFLASDKADFITGQVISPNGGLVI